MGAWLIYHFRIPGMPGLIMNIIFTGKSQLAVLLSHSGSFFNNNDKSSKATRLQHFHKVATVQHSYELDHQIYSSS